jgi:hypothetical protein
VTFTLSLPWRKKLFYDFVFGEPMLGSFEAMAISSRGYDSDQKPIGSAYDISCCAGLTSRHDKLGVFC